MGDGGGQWSEAVRERRGTGWVLCRVRGIVALEILCCEDRTRFAGPAWEDTHGVVLTRSGGFLRRVGGQEFFVDATGGYLTRPGDEHHIAHPLGPGDVSTQIHFDEQLVADRFDRRTDSRHLVTTGQADLCHRALVAAARRGTDELELAERLYGLLDEVASAAGAWHGGEPRRIATARAHRRLAHDACLALAQGASTVGVEELGRIVGASPHHLSRVFRTVTGRTLTWYRNQLRVRRVLQELQDGATSLRALAAAHGFADQAHLTRVVRQHTGQPPRAVRELLTTRSSSGDSPRD